MIASNEGTTGIAVVVIGDRTADTADVARIIMNNTHACVIIIDDTTDYIVRDMDLIKNVHRRFVPIKQPFLPYPLPSKNKWYDFNQQWPEYTMSEVLTYIFIAVVLYNIRSRLWKRHIKPFRWT